MPRSRNLERVLKLVLVLMSFTLAIAASEGVLRLLYPKSDIVPAEPEKDPILKHRILPYQSGHDGKGFRNDSAEGRFPVVCLGDSFIYGNNVPRRNAIPQQLSRLLKMPVYNMGMGGYGPVQYYYLIDEAKKMGAGKIVIAYYMGNDITDASAMSERYDYWKFLREGTGPGALPIFEPCTLPYETKDPTYWEPDIVTIQLKSSDSLLWRAHSFLRVNSVFYGMAYEHAMKPAIQALFEKEKHLHQPGAFYSKTIDIVFRPSIVLTALDLKNEQVRWGMEVIRRIIALTAEKYQNREDFLFVLIPTKESVYYNFFKNKGINIPVEYECQVHYEKIAAHWIEKELASKGFKYKDGLPAMEKEALKGAALYPPTSDDHPNLHGYEIIANQVYFELKDTVNR